MIVVIRESLERKSLRRKHVIEVAEKPLKNEVG
jgi:hypothetical protein